MGFMMLNRANLKYFNCFAVNLLLSKRLPAKYIFIGGYLVALGWIK
jgi:hypothetical protein